MAAGAIEQAKGFLPELSVLSVADTFTSVIIFLVIATAVAIATYFFLVFLKYDKKVVIFENVGGNWQVTKRDKGRLVRLKNSKHSALMLRKLKIPLARPSKQVGPKTYWYAVRADGTLVNWDLEDIDLIAGKSKIRFLDKDILLADKALDEIFKERYDKPKFWEKYGALLVNITAVVIIMVFLWLIVGKLIELTNSVNGAVETANLVLDRIEDLLVATDNICNVGGTGLVPVS